METKKVTLNNGTELEVGKKYRLDDWNKANFEVKAIGINTCFGIMTFEDGRKQDRMYSTEGEVWLPYTEPTPQKEWKTFLIEVDVDGDKFRRIEQYFSYELALKYNYKASSITEVKLTIEPVNI